MPLLKNLKTDLYAIKHLLKHSILNDINIKSLILKYLPRDKISSIIKHQLLNNIYLDEIENKMVNDYFQYASGERLFAFAKEFEFYYIQPKLAPEKFVLDMCLKGISSKSLPQETVGILEMMNNLKIIVTYEIEKYDKTAEILKELYIRLKEITYLIADYAIVNF